MRQVQILVVISYPNGQPQVAVQGGAANIDAEGKATPVDINMPQLVAEGMSGLAMMVRDMQPKKEGPQILRAAGVSARLN